MLLLKMVSIPLRGIGYEKPSPQDAETVETIIVSIPLRGIGYEKLPHTPISPTKKVFICVSIPLRGIGYEKRDRCIVTYSIG